LLAVVLALGATGLVSGCGGGGSDSSSPPSKAEKRKAVAVSKVLYKVAKTYGTFDINKGPCIGNPIPNVGGGDWVADLVHVPRKPIDDEPANQCPLFRDGKAHHFVELDIKTGKVVRVQ
jgi:hypothetical protein